MRAYKIKMLLRQGLPTCGRLANPVYDGGNYEPVYGGGNGVYGFSLEMRTATRFFFNNRGMDMRKIYFLPLTALVFGCSRGPVEPSVTRQAPPTVHFDGGGMVGSGNFAPVDSSEATRASAQTNAEAPGDSSSRGGGMVGSGN